MKKIFIIAGLIVFVLFLTFVFRSPSSRVGEKEIIKIGLIAPLSGEAAAYGEPVLEGVRVALDEINNSNKFKYYYQLISEDGKCSGGPAVSAAQKLINIDRVKYIIGGSCSSENLAMGPITESSGVLVISPFASSPDISNIGPYTYRTAPSDLESGVFIGNYLRGKYSRIAILNENTDFAQASGAVVAKTFTDMGGVVSIMDSFQSSGENFTSQVLKIKNSNAEAVFINPQSESNLIGILRQMQEQGLNIPQYGFFLTSDSVAQNPYARGITMIDAPNITSQKGKKFESAFFAKFNRSPSFPFAAAAAYDAMYLIAEGVQKNGNSPENVKRYLDEIVKYVGASGDFYFDENGDPKGHRYVIKRVQDGKFIEVDR